MDENKKKEKKKEKKKKERVDINLPRARASMKRSREVQQIKTNHEDLWKLIIIIIIVGAILFVLLGGINQRAAWETFKSFGKKIGETVSKWFEGGELQTNENGIYWRP